MTNTSLMIELLLAVVPHGKIPSQAAETEQPISLVNRS